MLSLLLIERRRGACTRLILNSNTILDCLSIFVTKW